MADRARDVCAFCGEGEEAGGLRNTIDGGILAHYNCLIFSPLVVLEPLEGSQDYSSVFNIPSVRKEITRGKRLRCSYCKKSGATIGCTVKQCRRTYHYPCVLKAKGEPIEAKYIVYCFKHAKEKSGRYCGQMNNHVEISETSRALEQSSGTHKNITREKRKRMSKTANWQRKKRKTGIVQNRKMGIELENDHRNSDQLFDPIITEDMELSGPSTSTFTKCPDSPIIIDSNSDSDQDLPIFDGSQLLQIKKENEKVQSINKMSTEESITQMSTEHLKVPMHSTPCEHSPSTISKQHSCSTCKISLVSLSSLVISASTQDDLNDEQPVTEETSNGTWPKTTESATFIQTTEAQSASLTHVPIETNTSEHFENSTLVTGSRSEQHNTLNEEIISIKSSSIKTMNSHLITLQSSVDPLIVANRLGCTNVEQLAVVRPAESNNALVSTDSPTAQHTANSYNKDKLGTHTACSTYDKLFTEAQPEDHFTDKPRLGIQPIDSFNCNTRSAVNPLDQHNNNSIHYKEIPSISDDKTLNPKSTQTKVHYIDIKCDEQKVSQNPLKNVNEQLFNLSNTSKSSDKKDLMKTLNGNTILSEHPKLSTNADGSVGTCPTSSDSSAVQSLDLSMLLPSTVYILGEQPMFSGSIDKISSEQPLCYPSRTLNEEIVNTQITSKTSAEQPISDINKALNESSIDSQITSKTLDEQSRNSVARTLDFSDEQATKDQCRSVTFSPLSTTVTSFAGQSSDASVVKNILPSDFLKANNTIPIKENVFEGTSMRDKASTVSSRFSEAKGVKTSQTENDPEALNLHRKEYNCKSDEWIPLNHDQKIQLLESYRKTEKEISDSNNMGADSAQAFWDLCLKNQCQQFLLELVKCSVESVIQKIIYEEPDKRDYEQAFTFLQASGSFQDFIKGESSQNKASSKMDKLTCNRNNLTSVRVQCTELKGQKETLSDTMGTRSPKTFSFSSRSKEDMTLPESSCSNIKASEKFLVHRILQDLQIQQQCVLNCLLQYYLQQQDQDADEAFAMSLIPFLRKVPEGRKLDTRIALEHQLSCALGQNPQQQYTQLCTSPLACHGSRQTPPL